MAGHSASIEWTCDGDFAAGRYSRAHELRFDGGATVRASASPQIVRPPLSDPAAVDPEEMLVASASSCHMLWFLDLAQCAGLSIVSYSDDAEGTLGKDERGRTAMIRILLSPRIVFAGDAPSDTVVADLHHRAHESCFIANTLRCPVDILPPTRRKTRRDWVFTRLRSLSSLPAPTRRMERRCRKAMKA